MHECASGWSFRLRDGPLRTPDVPTLPHPHHALLRHAVPSRTAGLRSSGLPPGSLTPPRPATAPPAPLWFPNSSVPGLGPRPGPDQSPTPRHADPDPLDPGGDGSSPPPHLFKTTTEHDRSSLPSTSASPGPRIRPILEGFSPAGNGFLKAVPLNKTTTEHDPPPPPPTGPSRDPEATPDSPLGGRGRLLEGRALRDHPAGSGRRSSRLGPPGAPPTLTRRSLPTGRGSCPRLPSPVGPGLRGRAVSSRTAPGDDRQGRPSDSLSTPQGEGFLQGHRPQSIHNVIVY
jgi:hypothetical protein